MDGSVENISKPHEYNRKKIMVEEKKKTGKNKKFIIDWIFFVQHKKKLENKSIIYEQFSSIINFY